MTRALAAIVVALACGIHAAAAQQTSDLESPELRIGWAEFKKLYDSRAIVVVDVRGDDAFALGHIPGARSIPLARIANEASRLRKLNKPIVAYCA
jgi:rhodanese-related sulfurtransferase